MKQKIIDLNLYLKIFTPPLKELTNKLNSSESSTSNSNSVVDETVKKLNEQLEQLRAENTKLNEHIKVSLK